MIIKRLFDNVALNSWVLYSKVPVFRFYLQKIRNVLGYNRAVDFSKLTPRKVDSNDLAHTEILFAFFKIAQRK